MSIKAFAYLRVSGRGQVDGDGFPRQIAAIEKYAESNDITIAQVFQDEGVSGTKELDNRPALQNLVYTLLSNGVRTVLIERLDRLARDLMIQETIIADFRKHGVTLISVGEPDLLSSDPTRTLMRQIMGAFAEYDRAMITAKLRGARERKKAATGRCEGQKPYGHYPNEPATLDRLRVLRAEGLSYKAIADRLNLEGIKPRSGKLWYDSSIRSILIRS